MSARRVLPAPGGPTSCLAAASALSARYLARPDAAVLGILGCGVQARTHAEALATLFSVERVMAYDIHPDRARRFAEEIGSRFDLTGEAVATPCHQLTRLPRGGGSQ